MAPLVYYFVMKNIIEHVIFSEYTIDNGVVKNAKGEKMAYNKDKAGYNRCDVYDDNGKLRRLRVARAIASTIYGPPPTLSHTADHKDKNRGNDIDNNIRWSTKSEQSNNRSMPETFKTARVVIKDGVEKTGNEWVDYLKDEKNPFGREYTINVILKYAQKKQYGFSYKEYPDLPGEIWKEINGSKNTRGRWEVSDMNRFKYVTNHAENILSGERLGMSGGYPNISINGKHWLCHILVYITFFPEKYANKKLDEIVLHEDDDPLDFRPHKLRLGTKSDNNIDSYNNGKRYGTKTARMKCVSYIDGIYEITHDSQDDAVKYLRHIGYDRVSNGRISDLLNPETTRKSAYDRTWKKL